MNKHDRKQQQLISFYQHRTLIGVLGVSLPVVLWLVNLIINKDHILQPSISDYYSVPYAGTIFTGILFILAAFLYAYRGYESSDNIVSNIGCIGASGTALFPTSYPETQTFHFLFALLLFFSFILFTLWLFRKKGDTALTEKEKNEKIRRNRLFLICGITMIACILAIGYLLLIKKIGNDAGPVIFYLETLLLFAFGLAWLEKGHYTFLYKEYTPESGK